MKYLLYSLLILLSSCARHRDGGSGWDGGLWIIPTLTGLASLWFCYLSVKASKSNSTQQMPDGSIKNNTGNVPVYKMGKFYFFLIFLLATAAIIVLVNGDR